MKRKIVINPAARIAHIPKELIEQGLTGEVDGYCNAVTLTLVSPLASLDEVEQSLKIVLLDIDLRRKHNEMVKAITKVKGGV